MRKTLSGTYDYLAGDAEYFGIDGCADDGFHMGMLRDAVARDDHVIAGFVAALWYSIGSTVNLATLHSFADSLTRALACLESSLRCLYKIWSSLCSLRFRSSRSTNSRIALRTTMERLWPFLSRVSRRLSTAASVASSIVTAMVFMASV